MTNETKSRIHAYMEELPHMKEKVFGALLMFVIAAVVVVSATYAWITLSRSPEISEITTTLAANGALEIALVKPDGTMPDEFDIDESVTQDTNVTVSNLQWGNLVNLSDASYGIDNVALRPAKLDKTSLLTSPLSGAAYGEDGRITEMTSNYAYVKYKVVGETGQFMTSNEYGVRAIATYTAEVSEGTQKIYDEKVRAVRNASTIVNQTYKDEADVASKFSALGTMISTYATDKLNSSFTSLAHEIENMLPIYYAVRETMDVQKDAYVALANLQYYLLLNELGRADEFTELTWNSLVSKKADYNTKSADVKSKDGNISLVGLTQFISDYDLIQKDIMYLEQYQADFDDNGSTYYWGGYYKDANGNQISDNSVSGYALNNIVGHLIDYTSMTIDLDNNGVETKVTGLSKDNAGSLLGANNDRGGRSVYIYGGVLYRMEQNFVDDEFRIGKSGKNASCTIRVSYSGIPITVYGKAYTKASGACTFMENYTATLGTKLVAADMVAEDTYGLAIDFWLRTNAEETCLTLEGATSTDEQGNIVSYDGVNRVWGHTGEAALTTNSTTQGGGSCYVYYADSPADQKRSLELLNAMKVAFVDANGDLLATAEMDTAHPWEVNGRITVPLVLSSDAETTYTYVDSMNVVQLGRAVTTLYTDLPIRVTAIVYLDGTRLTNEHVLAAAEIQGALNIQFGSSLELKTLGSNDLIDDTRTVAATANKTLLDYDKAQVDAELTTRVTVDVEGTEPTNVTAFFVRAINSTQGTRERTMEFDPQPGQKGKWYHDYTFDAPGIYYLRHVRLDGVDYTLEQPLKVEVLGFGLDTVRWSEAENNVTICTSEGTHSTTVMVRFATDSLDKEPATVQAHFVRDDGNTVSVPLSRNANSEWVGSGTFTASGVYQLQYLVANGNRYIDLALNDGTYRTMDLSLGMYVTITDLSGAVRQDYEDGKTYPKDVAVRLYNNAGTELEELENLILYYSNGTNLLNTISTNLDWGELSGYYEGTLPIAEPGQYQFAYVMMTDGRLDKCDDAPVYVIRSSKPLVYDEASDCTKDGIQYVPLTNNAVIDGIYIKNATSAVSGSAVVYSEETGRYHMAEMVYDGGYTDADGKTVGAMWAVKLPAYDSTTIVDYDIDGNPIYDQTQDGTWRLAAVRLWNCCDVDGNDRTVNNPLLWVDESSLGENYLATLSSNTKVDGTHDYSALTTTVSSEVKVTMVPGNTKLGERDATPFGTAFSVGDTKMSVIVTDGDGRAIPANVDVALTVKYNGNTGSKNIEDYGYEVNGAATYTIGFALVDGETVTYGVETVGVTNTKGDIDTSWKYVGVYEVTGLSVTVGGRAVDAAYFSNVPAQYTVATLPPTMDNVKAVSGGLNDITFGVDLSGNRMGEFLDPLDMTDNYVSIAVKATGNSDITMNSVVFQNMSVGLSMNYTQGSSITYGGYDFIGQPFDGTLALTNSGSSTAGGTYRAPSSLVIPAGEYTPTAVVIKIGEASTTTALSEIMNASAIEKIKVYSKLPSVKITAVSPTTEVTVNTNADPGSNTAAATSTFKATNSYDKLNGRWAIAYMAYAQGASSWNDADGCNESGVRSDYANYTAPTVSFQLSDAGSADAVMELKGNMTPATLNHTVNFTFKNEDGVVVTDVSTTDLEIGKVTAATKSGTHDAFLGFIGGHSYEYTIETATLLGSATVDEIVSTVGDVTYYRTLANSIIVSQPNKQNPKLTWNAGTGVTIVVTDKEGKTYSGTTEIPIMTELIATVTADFGYHNPEIDEPIGVSSWQEDESQRTETTKVYTFQIMDDAKLTARATKYHEINFSEIDGVVDVSVDVTVDGVTKSDIGSKTGIKPGAKVTVKLTADEADNVCWPRLDLSKCTGVTTWTDEKNGTNADFEYVYEFTMPDATVTLATPTTTAMNPVTWTNSGQLTFAVVDEGTPLNSGDHVVPGHELTISVYAEGEGSINPSLVSPTADLQKTTLISAIYTYEMPGSAVELKGKVTGYPELTVGKQGTNYVGVDVDIKNAGISANGHKDESNTAGSVGIKPGNQVEITLTATDGYYNPRMTKPASVDVSTWRVKSEGLWSASYSFTMPNAVTDATKCIAATPLPTVTLDSDSVSVVGIEYTGFNGVKKTGWSADGVKVAPNTEVTVTLSANAAYHTPVLSGATKVSGDYSQSVYKFNVGTDNVVMEPTATDNPTVTLAGTDKATMSISYTGYSASTNSPVKVRPGTVVTVTAKDEGVNYYNPTVSVSSGGVSLSPPTKHNVATVAKESGSVEVYRSITYTFEMKEDAVVLTGNGTANPTITYVRGGTYSGDLTLTVDGVTGETWGYGNDGSSASVRPGAPVSYTVKYDNESGQSTVITYDGSKNSFSVSNQAFSMPAESLTFKVDSKAPDVCITGDTLVTLADGTQKMIKDIKGDEMLLVWNHYTGKVDVAPILVVIDHGGQKEKHNVIKLEFSDGTYVEIIGEHVFFDTTLNKYVGINAANVDDLVGHSFAQISEDGDTLGEIVLTGYSEENRVTTVYEINTYYHSVAFVNGMLSSSAYSDIYLNCYDFFGDNLSYSEEAIEEDIEKYGFYTYEDFERLISKEIFEAFHFYKLKIGVAKGHATWEEIVEICNVWNSAG